ncbi:OmpW family outer membrane protein [Pseudomonas kuykendallii]|uniref:OmpW/AlkL family protein n=1 Tax=Pseudomonas kuykendallii TaxID=1007099 RepID=UPI0028D5D024|nr:OmpW family outer membrane protein [Pseudomonas kuykendallii]
MRKSLFTLSVLAMALAAPLAQAFEAGDIIVRAGAVTVSTHEDSSGVKVDRGSLAGTDLGGKATMDNDTQLGLNFAYMVTDHVGVELLAATPFTHDVNIKGAALGNGKLGTLKHLPPTLSLVYYPLDKKSAFQPYIGAGINYTWIMDGDTSSEAEAGGFRDLQADNSWGWAAQIGADYMLTDNLLINAQVRYIDLDTTAYVDNVDLGVRAKVDVDVSPYVYMIGLGYKF